MTQRAQPIESHEVHSRRFIQHAYEELDKGDRLQASEKAWGAVAHRLKVIANERGWKYVTHSDAYDVADRIERELGEPRIGTLFSVANGLHRNFYVDSMPIQRLHREVGWVEELLELLAGVE